MTTFRAPDQTQIGHVHLRVSDSERAMEFYHGLIGLQEVSRDENRIYLSATGQPPFHVILTELQGARPKPPRTRGLFHNAIRFPDREALSRALHRLIEHRYPLGGFSDHKVSEAIYLGDPDGNGVELYADRPREVWPRMGEEIAMVTDPLDLDDLLAQAVDGGKLGEPVHPGTDIGHVHLHVSDLAKGEAFYHGVLGFDITQRTYVGALFLSAGGYHHHIGLNIWAGQGAPAPPADAVGLISFSVQLPDSASLQALVEHVEAAGVPSEGNIDYGHLAGVLLHDFDGNRVELLAPLDSPFDP